MGRQFGYSGTRASPPSRPTLAWSTGTHRAKGALSPSRAPRGLGGAVLWSHSSLTLCASMFPPAKWGQRGSQQPGLLGGLNELTSVKCLARGQDSVNPYDFNARDDKEVFVAQARRRHTRCCPCAVDPVGRKVVESHACFPGRPGSCVRKRLQVNTCASADDCASAASVDTVGARRRPPQDPTLGTVHLVLSPLGRRGPGHQWAG